MKKKMNKNNAARLAGASLVGLVLISFADDGAASRAFSQDGLEARDRISNTRTAMEEWVETERAISRERRDWVLGRELLNDRIALIEREIEGFEKSISDAGESIAEADKKRLELVAKNDGLKAASDVLDGIAAEFEEAMRGLLSRLPDPIRDRVKPLSQRLPKEGEEVETDLSERFMNMVGILNEIDKFNQQITLTSEVRELDDGTAAEVAAMYVGLGQAYFATNNGRSGGVGRASESAWVWESADAAALDIKEAIAVLKNETPAKFVRLPIVVTD